MSVSPAVTAGAAALAPVIPLTLTALAHSTGTAPSSGPIPDRSGLWLRNAAAGLFILAAAAAAVSFTAQSTAWPKPPATCPPAHRRPGSRHPGRRRLGLRLPGHRLALHGRRALRARALNLRLRRHLQIPLGDAPVPARGGQPCPPGIAPIRLSIAETARLASLAAHYTAGLITRARLAFALRWSARRRRHQATARWHHYSARLLAVTGTG